MSDEHIEETEELLEEESEAQAEEKRPFDRYAALQKARQVRLDNLEAQRNAAAREAEAAARKAAMPDPQTIRDLGITDEFTEDELIAIRAEAAKKVADQLKKEKRDRLIRLEMDRERQRHGLPRLQPDIDREFLKRISEMVSYTINLPENADRLRIDGQQYFHGHTYQMSRALYDTARDIVGRLWHQEALRLGQKSSYFNAVRGHYEMDGGHPAGSRPWQVAL